MMLEYRYHLRKWEKGELRFIGGLVYDYFTIYLDGEISPESERREVFEQFERQALPYPYLGIGGKLDLNEKSGLQTSVRGTYIPKFNSFFHEGGDVALQYNSLIWETDYYINWSKFQFEIGASYRSIYLLGDSAEDTNEFSLSSLGPYIKLEYTIF